MFLNVFEIHTNNSLQNVDMHLIKSQLLIDLSMVPSHIPEKWISTSCFLICAMLTKWMIDGAPHVESHMCFAKSCQVVLDEALRMHPLTNLLSGA